jgi:DNA-binding XRE family transcriptional regulator
MGKEFIKIEKIIKRHNPNIDINKVMAKNAGVTVQTIKRWRNKSCGDRVKLAVLVIQYFNQKEWLDFIKDSDIWGLLLFYILEERYYCTFIDMKDGKKDDIRVADYIKKYGLKAYNNGADWKFECEFIRDYFLSITKQKDFYKALKEAHEKYKKFIKDHITGVTHSGKGISIRVDIEYKRRYFNIKIPAYWIQNKGVKHA